MKKKITAAHIEALRHYSKKQPFGAAEPNENLLYDLRMAGLLRFHGCSHELTDAGQSILNYEASPALTYATPDQLDERARLRAEAGQDPDAAHDDY